MPELPEVEVARRWLSRWSAGRAVVDVRVEDPACVRPRLDTRPSAALPDGAAALRSLVGEARGVVRRGKRLGWASGCGAVLVHLGMTGHWVRRTSDEVPRFGRCGLVLDDGATLWFTDARRFGCLVPVASFDALGEGLGPDALDEPCDGEALARRVGGRGPIKPRLLDQGRLAGLGNIHAAEALWRAGLAPDRSADALDGAAWARLADAIVAQLRFGLEVTDAEEVVYLSDGGANPFTVYGREGAACPRCGGSVQRRIQAGRSTFWCPGCQT